MYLGIFTGGDEVILWPTSFLCVAEMPGFAAPIVVLSIAMCSLFLLCVLYLFESFMRGCDRTFVML